MSDRPQRGWLRRYWGAVAGVVVIGSELASPAIWNQPIQWIIVGLAGAMIGGVVITRLVMKVK